jgi:hypothetical protein
MYDLDEVTAWLNDQYIPWYNTCSDDASKGGAHTNTSDRGPPPPPPPTHS